MEAAGGRRSDAASNVTRLTYIDGLRAIAVLAIVVWHGAQGASHPAAPPAFWLWGNRGVDLFFVISGFCLSYPFLKAYRRTNTLRIDYADFLVRRISRIAPPYYAAVALFAVLATTSFGLPTTWFASQARAGWQEIVLDLFFLTSRAPLHNASFWTLGVEMRWYLLCPLLIALFVRSRAAFTILLLALWTSYTLTPWSISDLGMLPCFMLGIVAAHVALGPPRYRRITFVVASCTVGIALYQSLNGEIDHGNPLWHLACFLIVVCARDARFARDPFLAAARRGGSRIVCDLSRARTISDLVRIPWLPLGGCVGREHRCRIDFLVSRGAQRCTNSRPHAYRSRASQGRAPLRRSADRRRYVSYYGACAMTNT